MSIKTARALSAARTIEAHQKVIAKLRKQGVDVEAEGFDAYAPRNRRERRARIHTLPRNFRTQIHGWGQWRKKVVNADGELERG